jgi:alginate O-acetyltransferase complex protein AlgI
LGVHRVFSQWRAEKNHAAERTGPTILLLLPLKVATTFLCVCIGWVFFRAQTFADAWTVLTRMFWPTEGQGLAIELTLAAWALLALVLMCHLLGTFVNLKRIERKLPAPVLGATLAALLLLAQLLMPESGATFIYFQF